MATYTIGGRVLSEQEYQQHQRECAQRLRQKYMQNPPEGYTSAEIQRMRDDDILDMNYFLHEFDHMDSDWD